MRDLVERYYSDQNPVITRREIPSEEIRNLAVVGVRPRAEKRQGDKNGLGPTCEAGADLRKYMVSGPELDVGKLQSVSCIHLGMQREKARLDEFRRRQRAAKGGK